MPSPSAADVLKTAAGTTVLVGLASLALMAPIAAVVRAKFTAQKIAAVGGCHLLHAAILAGVEYRVERSRDPRSFSVLALSYAAVGLSTVGILALDAVAVRRIHARQEKQIS